MSRVLRVVLVYFRGFPKTVGSPMLEGRKPTNKVDYKVRHNRKDQQIVGCEVVCCRQFMCICADERMLRWPSRAPLPWSVEETAVRFVVPWATSFPIGIYAQLRDQTRLHAASLISC